MVTETIGDGEISQIMKMRGEKALEQSPEESDR